MSFSWQSVLVVEDPISTVDVSPTPPSLLRRRRAEFGKEDCDDGLPGS